jgi:hypothetical protein
MLAALLFDIRSLDKIVKRAMVIPRRRLSGLLLGYAWKSRSGSRGIPARFAVESALALPWNQRSVWRGIRTLAARCATVRSGLPLQGREPALVPADPSIERTHRSRRKEGFYGC